MVDFMGQLDWATRCPDIWWNILLAVSVRVFPDEADIYISKLSKADHPPQCGRAWPNRLEAWIEQKDWVMNSLSAWHRAGM